jgi:hypothetical protein
VAFPARVVNRPPAPPDPLVEDPGCADTGVSVSYNVFPTAGIRWFWQTTPTGEDTTQFANPTTLFSSQSLFLRARTNIGHCWGPPTDTVAVQVYPTPNLEPNVWQDGPRCADTGVTVRFVGNPAPGPYRWYWQPGPNTKAQSLLAGDTLVFQSDTLWLRVFDTGTGCWSETPYAEPVVVNPMPTIQLSDDTACFNQPVSLYAVTEPGNSVYWWREALPDRISNEGRIYLTQPLQEPEEFWAVAITPENCVSLDTPRVQAYVHTYIPLEHQFNRSVEDWLNP